MYKCSLLSLTVGVVYGMMDFVDLLKTPPHSLREMMLVTSWYQLTKSSVEVFANLGNLLEEGAFSSRSRSFSLRVSEAIVFWWLTEDWSEEIDEDSEEMRVAFC